MRWRVLQESRLPGDLPPISFSDCCCNPGWCGHRHRSLPAPVRNNNNNTIWRGSVLTGEEPPPHSGELKHALSQAGGPTQSQLSRPLSSGHHISMEHRRRRKQLTSDTDANNENSLKEKKRKDTKKLTKTQEKGRNKANEASMGYYPRRLEKMFVQELQQEIVKQLRLKNQISSTRKEKKGRRKKKEET